MSPAAILLPNGGHLVNGHANGHANGANGVSSANGARSLTNGKSASKTKNKSTDTDADADADSLAHLDASLRRLSGPNTILANSYASPIPSGASTPAPALDLGTLQTERRNAATHNIDIVSTEEMCGMINAQDMTVAGSVQRCIPEIARVIDELAPKVARGGRVVYVGAGTSGRLGILDASEIPPTFSAPYGQWIGLIAGGNTAIQYAVEGAEDSRTLGASDVAGIDPPLGPLDSVLGLAASGRTPYVLGAMGWARARGLFTAGICCVAPSAMRAEADTVVECPVGPEVVTGSTRMKSGTAQKMILNMISTGVQLRIGKTYGNLMVDVKRSNAKLVDRARRIFRAVLEPYVANAPLSVSLDDDAGIDALVDMCGGSVKAAMVAARWGCSPQEAAERLENVGGLLKRALEE